MPDGLSPQQRRNYVLLLAAAGLYFSGISFLLLLPKFLKSLGAGETELGWLIGTPLVTFMLLAPYAGFLADRVPPKRLAVGGIALAAVGGAGLMLVTEVSVYVYLLRLLQGAGHALAFTSIFSMVAQTLSPAQKARGIAHFTVVIQAGNVLGSLIGSLLLEHVSHVVFFAVSTVFVMASSLAALRVASPPRAGGGADGVRYRQALGQRSLWSGMVLVLLLGGAFGTVLQFVPTYLDVLYESGAAAAPIASFWFLTATLATVALVRLLLSGQVYRPGRERALTACMLGLPLSVLLLVGVHDVGSTVLAAIAFGATYGLLFPAINALVLVRAGALRQGAISGFLAMLYEVGFRGFGFVMGPIAENYGYFSMFYWLAGALAVGVLGFFLLEGERRKWLLGARA